MALSNVSDYVRGCSKALLELKAQVGRMQACQDALEAVVNCMVVLPEDLLGQVDVLVGEGRQLGFETREQFVIDAVRFRLTWFKEDNQCLEVPREQYDMLEEAITVMGAPFRSADDFISSQISQFLEKYEEYKNSDKR